MTDETRAALEQATEALRAAREQADAEKLSCLAQIATGIPERAEEAAKRVATEQPEVTRALGKDGVANMRLELHAASEKLGRQFVAAVDEIKWPTQGRVDTRHIHSALFDRFYKKTGALSQVLTAHGYHLGQTDPFIPQFLYDEASFKPLADALTVLAQAEAKLRNAKKADDDAAVEDLWGS